jgi:DNA-binding CsgD family transcriptional regulator
VSVSWDDVIGSVNGHDVNVGRPALPCAKVRQRYSYKQQDEEVTITLRERETLALIITGLTVPQAAAELGLSTRTVEFYVKNLRFKLHCRSKRELIAFAKQYDVLQQLSISYY